MAAFGLVALLGLALVLAQAAGHVERFTFGVEPTELAVPLEPRQEACQMPVEAQGDFSAVQLMIATYLRPGPPLELTIRDARTGRPIAGGRLAGGYPDNSKQTIETPLVHADEQIWVCVRDEGRRGVVIYGDEGGEAAPESHVRVDGKPRDADMSFVFIGEERPLSGLLADIFRRAALFHPQWVGPWTFWLLLGAVVLAVPLLLAASLAMAVRAPTDPPE